MNINVNTDKHESCYLLRKSHKNAREENPGELISTVFYEQWKRMTGSEDCPAKAWRPRFPKSGSVKLRSWGLHGSGKLPLSGQRGRWVEIIWQCPPRKHRGQSTLFVSVPRFQWQFQRSGKSLQGKSLKPHLGSCLTFKAGNTKKRNYKRERGKRDGFVCNCTWG